MGDFVQYLANGLAVGGIYALIALGYTMVYGVLKLINFAHGDLFAFGAFVGYSALVSWGFATHLGPFAAVAAAVAVAVVLAAAAGYALERVAYRPLRHSDRLSAVVSALGASIFIQNALMLGYGSESLSYPNGLTPTFVVPFLGARIPAKSLVVLATSALVMAALQWFIHRTRTGLAIRASAIDQGAAQLMGVDVRRVISIVFVIGPALGGLAGLMVGLQYGTIDFGLGQMYGLKAFTAAIIGGIGNIPGAMLGGLLLGVVEAMGEAYISGAWKDAITFGALALVLVARPTGLLRERVAEKL